MEVLVGLQSDAGEEATQNGRVGIREEGEVGRRGERRRQVQRQVER